MTSNALPAYRRLAQLVQHQINQGDFTVGDKMPSLRQFAKQHDISMTTAIRCFELLQDAGYLTAKAKSGFYLSLPLNLANPVEFLQFNSETTTLSTTAISQYGTANSHAEAALATAQLSPALMPSEALQRCINRVLRRQNNSQFLYGDPQGSQALRNALAQHFGQQGLNLQPQQLMITSGCIDAVTLALEVVSKPGDTIAVTSPCYHGLLQLLALLGRRIIELPSTAEGLDIEQLQALHQQNAFQACLITANHQNPSGHCLSVSQKSWLADFAANAQLPIIEDDVFCELSYQGPQPLPIKAWDKHGWVIWCGSVSKTLAPGLRLGWCHSTRFLDELVKRRYLRTMGVNQPLQEGLAEFINCGHYVRHLARIKPQLAKQLIDYRQFLMHRLPTDSIISNPRGGMVLWLRVPGLDGNRLAQEAAKQGIHIRPGSAFSSRTFYRDHFRLNIGWPLNKPRLQQLQSLVNLIQQALA